MIAAFCSHQWLLSKYKNNFKRNFSVYRRRTRLLHMRFFFLNGWNVLTVIGVNNSAKWYWWTNSLREQNVQIKFRQKNQDSEQIIWKIKNKIKQRCFVVRLKIEYLITVKVKVPKILGTVPIFCVLQRDSVGIIFDLSTIHSTSISFSTREIYRLSTSKYKILRV